MQITVTEHWSGTEKHFEGTDEQIENDLLLTYPFLHIAGAPANLKDTLEHLDSTGGFEVNEGVTRVALVTAYNAAGHLLLGKRNDNGKYTLPGGHLNPDEDEETGARRELLEETGLIPHSITYLTTHTTATGLVLYCYSAFVSGNPHGKNDPDQECEDWKFYDVCGGIPSKIANKLHGPPNTEDNLLLKLFDLKTTDSLKKSVPDTDLNKSDLHLFDVRAHSLRPVALDMLGLKARLRSTLEAARFVAGGANIDVDEARKFLVENDNIEETALKAYNLSFSEENLRSLRSALQSRLTKSQPVSPSAKVKASQEEGQSVADAVQRAYDDSFVLPIQLGGKHSDGSLIARDDQEDSSYLLKPGSGDLSPDAGVKDETASETAREAAFYHVAKDAGLGHLFPRCESLTIDGGEYAALELLPWRFKPAIDDERKLESTIAFDYLAEQGDLWKVAALDFVLGNPDRHGHNIMVDDQSDIKFIDHGSAFAGVHFDPAFDKNSFVPYYLRAHVVDWSKKSQQQRLDEMPRTSTAEAIDELSTWLAEIEAPQLEFVLRKYGIDPAPSVARLEKLKAIAGKIPVDQAICVVWVSV